MNKQLQSNFFLLLTAFIWGFAFVAQRTVTEHLPPFLYSGIRMYVGTASLLLIIFIAAKSPAFQRIIGTDPGCDREHPMESRKHRKLLIQSGLSCGIVMFFAANLQQVGLVFTTATKTGFITTLYIILVPLIGIFLKHKTTVNTWLGVALATVGLYLLCITTSFTITFGDFIVLIGALFWAIQILLMDHYVRRLLVMKIVAVQFFVAGTISFITAVFVDPWFGIDLQLQNFINAIPSILYVGILSTAGAATFQGLGQRYANPATASLILSTESVFGALCGFLVLGEILSLREFFGCVLMFTAILIVQIPTRVQRRQAKADKAASKLTNADIDADCPETEA